MTGELLARNFGKGVMQPEQDTRVGKGGDLYRKGQAMPALLPIILAGSHIWLAADQVPQFNVEPTCRAVHQATSGLKRDEAGCKRDELTAQNKLKQEWDGFSADQRAHCSRLSMLGGSPSYVELLTCLEIDKAAKNLPDRNGETTGQPSIEDRAGSPTER